MDLFQEFEKDLGGPVAAAKTLHILVPQVFPLWDRMIARGYHITLANAGSNGKQYWRFMRVARRQCRGLREQGYDKRNLLKRIDERNYVTYILGQPCC